MPPSKKPPSSPMIPANCADTATYAWPSRPIISWSNPQSGVVSVPEVTFIHSTSTVPLKSSAGGIRTIMRLVYGADVPLSAAFHIPSASSTSVAT